jgi:hypothetical protein
MAFSKALFFPLSRLGPGGTREQFRGHPDFEYTAQFCHLYDQNAFDPGYGSMPLGAFEPMRRRVLAAPKRSIYG